MKHQPTNSVMDRRVFSSMILLMFISLMVFSFRYRNYKPCSAVSIVTHAFDLYTGKIIRFEAKASNAKYDQLEWDFGDNTPNVKNEVIVNHIYQSAGHYEITLTINGKCREFTTIEITPAPHTIIKELQPQFSGPKKVFVGDPVEFKDSTAGAKQWEWWFGENNTVDAITKNAVYTFRNPGIKNVILRVNGTITGRFLVLAEQKPLSEGLIEEREINLHKPQTKGVKSKPDTEPIRDQTRDDTNENTPPQPTPKVAIINDTMEGIYKKGLENMLKEVIDDKKNVADFANFFCGNLNTVVALNHTKMSFIQLCNELKKIKKSNRVQTFNVKYEKDDSTDCIINMSVEVTVKKGIFNHFMR